MYYYIIKLLPNFRKISYIQIYSLRNVIKAKFATLQICDVHNYIRCCEFKCNITCIYI